MVRKPWPRLQQSTPAQLTPINHSSTSLSATNQNPTWDSYLGTTSSLAISVLISAQLRNQSKTSRSLLMPASPHLTAFSTTSRHVPNSGSSLSLTLLSTSSLAQHTTTDSLGARYTKRISPLCLTTDGTRPSPEPSSRSPTSLAPTSLRTTESLVTPMTQSDH